MNNSSRSSSQTSSFKEAKMSEPPVLDMNLHQKKSAIAITWTVLLIPTCILPNALYFGLRYSAKTETDIALTVPTAILGVFTVVNLLWRTFALLRKGSKSRPVGAAWWAYDYLNYNMWIGFGVVTAVLADGTGQEPPNIRQASMPQTIVLFLAGSQLVLTGIASQMRWPTPVRLSSTPAGSIPRPGVFVLTEDVVAVDGGGKEDFRRALLARYDASRVFQIMVAQLNWFWGVGSLLFATAMTVIIFVVDDENLVFALGWTLPWVWAAVGTLVTIFWVRRMLRIEKSKWQAI